MQERIFHERNLATKIYAKMRGNGEEEEKINYWKQGKLQREKRMTVTKGEYVYQEKRMRCLGKIQ